MKHPNAETTIKVPEPLRPLLEDLRELTVDGENPNYMTKREREGPWQSLLRLGWISYITADQDGMVADGQQRLETCIAHKEFYGPVLRLGVDDKDRRLIREVNIFVKGQADQLRTALDRRKIIELGGRDDLIRILQLRDKDIQDALGAKPREETYRIPPLEEVETDIQFGEIFALDQHRILCGDSTTDASFKAIMDPDRAHCVMTDPPYNVDYSDKTEFMLKIRKGFVRAPIEGDKITDLYAFLCDWLNAMKLHLTDYNTVYITFAEKTLLDLLLALKTVGYYHSQTLVWNKNTIVLGRSDYRYKHEPIVYCWFGKHKFYGKNERTVWDIPKPSQSKLHPTMKPVELCARAISNGSQAGEIILDPFAGSGSTLIACEQLDRKGRMIEIDPRYCQIIIDRWQAYTGKTASKTGGSP